MCVSVRTCVSMDLYALAYTPYTPYTPSTPGSYVWIGRSVQCFQFSQGVYIVHMCCTFKQHHQPGGYERNQSGMISGMMINNMMLTTALCVDHKQHPCLLSAAHKHLDAPTYLFRFMSTPKMVWLMENSWITLRLAVLRRVSFLGDREGCSPEPTNASKLVQKSISARRMEPRSW